MYEVVNVRDDSVVMLASLEEVSRFCAYMAARGFWWYDARRLWP